MEYHVQATVSAATLAALEDAFMDADPAGVVDQDAAHDRIRISTTLGLDDVWGILCDNGCPVTQDLIRTPPTTCCGGCST